jgi:amidase
MNARELMWCDLTEQARLVAGGEVSALELVDAAIARLEGAPELNALVHEQFEAARERARSVGGGALAGGGGGLAGGGGGLAGVPYLLKDLGEAQAGLPMMMGSRALRSHVASATAPTVTRYEAAGLIILGRTNTPEFGNHCATEPFLSGPTLNPWDLGRSPGGSSGGSAAAVAAGLIGAASGSDGTGSIRMPAACCGLVGLKPRRARVSFGGGAVPLDGLANTHALTRTVRDSARLLDVLAGAAVGDPFPPPAPGRRYVEEVGADPGVLRILAAPGPPFPGQVAEGVQAVTDRCAAVLAELGHAVEAGAPSFSAEQMRRSISVIHAVDNASTFTWLSSLLGRPPQPEELEPVTWDMVREGQATSGVEHAAAVAAMHEEAFRASQVFAEADVLLCPALNDVAPPPGTLSVSRGSVDAFFDAEFAFTGWTAVANACGWAAISLPVGEVGGLPAGVQLMAPDEAVLLRVAAQLEVAMPWAERRPEGYA